MYNQYYNFICKYSVNYVIASAREAISTFTSLFYLLGEMIANGWSFRKESGSIFEK